jgi:Tol biopolymer transport system component
LESGVDLRYIQELLGHKAGEKAMKNKTKIGLIIIAVFALVLISGYIKDKCGDGICQRWEERKGSCPEDCATFPTNSSVKSIKFLENIGGRLDISKEDVIVFDSKGSDGYYDVYRMNMDGAKRKCLTCDKVQVPQKHNGQPAWHPNGDFIVFQSVDPELKGLPEVLSRQEKILTGPGAGVNNNLWLTDKDGERFWQLTEIEDKKSVLHPHFSHDGKKLIWAEIVDQKVKPSGDWVIKIADVVIDENSTKLKNIIVLKPDNMQFFETHGFSADDSNILFSATPDGYYSNLDIYSYDLITKELKQLTGPDSEWDEHAQYSPDGKKIVWVSSKGISQKIQQYKVKTDYWIMDSNGENKMRITFFNDPQDKNYIISGVAAADNAWTSDGNILGYLIVGNHEADRNVLIEFE